MRIKNVSIFIFIITGILNAYEPQEDARSRLKWKFETKGDVKSSPAIAQDGTIYVGSNDCYLYAINPDGSLKWKFKTGGAIWSSPAIAQDGTIYVGSKDHYLYAINPDGSLKWKFKTGGPIYSSPAIAQDGTIYVGPCYCFNPYLYAINPDGSLKWKFKTGEEIWSSPIVSQDGTIYVGSWDGYLYVINPDGSLKWKFKTGGGIESSPAIAQDGTIYVGSRDYYLYAINSNGSLKWKFKTGDAIAQSSPAIAQDGTIYVGSIDNYLYAINPDGSLKWKFKTGGDIWSSPAIAQDGTIYVGSGDDCLYAINPDGSLKWKFETRGWVWPSPTIGPDGTVYFGSWDGYLYAIYDDNGGLADSPWPKFRHDILNTGNFTLSPEAVVEISTIEPPFLEIKSFEVIDEDGDGVFSAGEDAYVKVKIENSGKGDANNVKLKLSGFIERSLSIGKIRKGETVSKEIHFRVPLMVKTGKKSINLFVDAGNYSPEPITVPFYTQASIPEGKGLPEHPIFQNPNRIALVIGVGDYDKLPKLPCSINDARLMKEIVKKLMGVKDENLKYLENPSLAEMRTGIRWLVTKAMARKHPEVIVYYSGHGTTDETGEPYWLPVDADNNVNYLCETGMKVDEIYNKLTQITNAEIVVIVDACFSGKGKSVALKGAKPLFVAKITRPKDFSILLSSREDQISTYLEDIGYSTFTYAFYKTLLVGDALDDDGDGWIEVYEIKDYLVRKTKELSSAMGIIQIPIIEGTDAQLCPPIE